MFPRTRLRRLRSSPRIRDLVRETALTVDDILYPFFVDATTSKPLEVKSMPGQFRIPPKGVVREAAGIRDLGIPGIVLFGIPDKKHEFASGAFDPEGVVQRAVRDIKKECPELVVVTDVCLCEYTSSGHCGVLKGGRILNDETLDILERTALSHARAGADVVAPSGMMDGAVGSIRSALDKGGFQDTLIMSYSAKFASSFYGPFREAACCGPSSGDRKSHQMDVGNVREALREIELDIAEGADIVMVKPALPFLDVIHRAKEGYGVPVAAFNVSGEYAMVKAAARNGWLDGRAAMLECLGSIKRAGADVIITYFAKEFAEGFGGNGRQGGKAR